MDVDIFRGVTLTPTISLNRDDYRPNLHRGRAQLLQGGLCRRGACLAHYSWHQVPGVLYERSPQPADHVGWTERAPFPVTAYYNAEVADVVNTFITGVTCEVIPNALDVAATYTCSYSSNTQP